MPCPPIPVTSSSRSMTTRVSVLRGSLTFGRSGQPVDEEAPLYLLRGGCPRDDVDDLDAAWDLEPGEQSLAVAADVVQRRWRAVGARHDDRAHHLTPLLVGEGDHRDVADARTLRQDRLHLGRRDRLPARADHVASTADDGEVALVVDVDDV